MTDDELQRRLETHYRAIDPGHAPAALGARIDGALERRTRRTAPANRVRMSLAVGIAAVVVVAIGLVGLRGLPGFLSAPAPLPAPTGSPAASAPTNSPAASPTAVPSVVAATVDLAGTFQGGLWAIQGSTLLVSIDAGASWRRSPMPAVVPTYIGGTPTAFVLDPEHAWTVTPGPGSDPLDGSAAGVLHLVVHRTADGGRSWQESAVDGNFAGTAQVLVFVDPQHGYLLCSTIRFGPGVSTILRTDDGGATWSAAGTGQGLGSMFAASDASTLWAGAEPEAGQNTHPILDVSRDGGRTWQDARLPGLEGQVGGGPRWLAGPPVFLDPATGFVAVSANPDATGSPRTLVYRTVDGGLSWSVAANRPVEASAGLAVLDPVHWLLPIENPFGLLAATDWGSSWQALPTDGLANGGWIAWIGAVDADRAAALVPTGNSYPGPAALFLTADGGTTWRPADLGRSTGSVASSSASPSPSPTPALLLPGGSVPPISSETWTGLRLQPLDGGPVGASSVTTWSGGELALGQPSDQGSLPAWASRDGRSWVELPAGTFGSAGSAISAVAAPSGRTIVVAVTGDTGGTTVWRSADGATWTADPSAQLRLQPDSDLAGNETGVLAILEGSPYRLAFSPDGVTWQTVLLPADAAFSVQGVAAFGTGFVAVGDAGTKAGPPVAWWSADGLDWTRAAVEARPGGFIDVHAASSGLVALSSTGDTPGLVSYWTSPDGRSWTVSAADPLGIWHGGPGEGGAAGAFPGDGTRLLGHGSRAAGGPSEHWVSFDGIHWTKLALTGDAAGAAAAEAGSATPFLLRDGILFSSDQGSWFGAALK